MTKYRKNEAFIRNDGAHEGRAQCAKQAVVSPMNKGVLQALRRSRTTIANCGVHVISGIFCGAHGGRRLWRKQAEVSPVSNKSHKHALRAMWIDDCELWMQTLAKR